MSCTQFVAGATDLVRCCTKGTIKYIPGDIDTGDWSWISGHPVARLRNARAASRDASVPPVCTQHREERFGSQAQNGKWPSEGGDPSAYCHATVLGMGERGLEANAQVGERERGPDLHERR